MQITNNMAETFTVYVNQKPLILTNDEEQYFMPPAEHYQSYIYCKFKTEDDVTRILNICDQDEHLQLALIYAADFEAFKKTFRELFTEIMAAGGVVKNEDKDILLIFRKGKWDLPKGKADEGEKPEETAIREVKEETGLVHLELGAPILTTYHAYKEEKERFLKTTYWFEMTSSKSEKLVPQAEEKITDIRWVSPDNLEEYTNNTYPTLLPIFDKIAN